VGAIWVHCLPERIGWSGPDEIRLIQAPLDQNRLPEEVIDSSGLVEGAACRIMINAYERNPKARQKCIETYGSSCHICSFNFGAVYGENAEGFIHVHHLRPLS